MSMDIAARCDAPKKAPRRARNTLEYLQYPEIRRMVKVFGERLEEADPSVLLNARGASNQHSYDIQNNVDRLPALLTIDQAAEQLGYKSRSSLYKLINSEAIRTVQIGGRKRIPADEIRRLASGDCSSGEYAPRFERRPGR
ncbi:MAG: helix-turn-helix domain-containing protein [Pseudomonadota bacterium]